MNNEITAQLTLSPLSSAVRTIQKRLCTTGCTIVCALGCLLLGGMLPASAVKAQTDAETVGQLSGAAQEIVASINQHRVNAGLNALVVQPLLNQAAQGHANDMLANYNYSHRGSDGSSVKTRVARTGYAANPWVSENWVSSRSVEGAMRWWMNDYIHRVNILTGHWREVGVGIATRPNTGETIYVTVFSAGTSDPSVQPSIAPAAQPAPVPLPAVEVPPGGMDYTIRSGDTLLGIAIRHSLDWRVVAAGNGLGERSILQIGQVIRLPGVDAAGIQFSDDTTTGATASTDMENSFEQSSAPAVPQIETQPYTVQQGDTLFGIAARNGMTWQELAALNGFRENDYLQIGQDMKVPLRQANGNTATANGASEEASAVDTDVDGPTADALIVSTPVTEPLIEQVYGGEGVGAALQIQLERNSLQPATPTPLVYSASTVRQGAPEPMVPVAAARFTQEAGTTDEVAAVEAAVAETSTVDNEPSSYVVQSGDTIISIAVRHSLDWQHLLTLNGMGEQSLLQPGQEIRLR
jgi:uncharacterized protein YkwD/murein DD-endopeptidase MepM/ murein hydrolase activator NlpD